MNYTNLISLFETKCLEVSDEFSTGDIYKINYRDCLYPLTNLYIESVEQYKNTIVYNIQLYYVDVLLDDRSNQTIIQSDGLSILNDIANDFMNSFDVVVRLPLISTLFTERFTSECAGVFIRMRLEYNKTC